ncbi:hypothetical protein HPP92_019063 [Vanilla planifolia]|uniref:Uncharacterized protein n=1 Tax=Vanilla planifolia TaxID=51239 RepID=A0A835Q3D2_VANPL|nr:hypothetical protein HPP92_019063 [Vanilla planifolia]
MVEPKCLGPPLLRCFSSLVACDATPRFMNYGTFSGMVYLLEVLLGLREEPT